MDAATFGIIRCPKKASTLNQDTGPSIPKKSSRPSVVAEQGIPKKQTGDRHVINPKINKKQPKASETVARGVSTTKTNTAGPSLQSRNTKAALPNGSIRPPRATSTPNAEAFVLKSPLNANNPIPKATRNLITDSRPILSSRPAVGASPRQALSARPSLAGPKASQQSTVSSHRPPAPTRLVRPCQPSESTRSFHPSRPSEAPHMLRPIRPSSQFKASSTGRGPPQASALSLQTLQSLARQGMVRARLPEPKKSDIVALPGKAMPKAKIAQPLSKFAGVPQPKVRSVGGVPQPVFRREFRPPVGSARPPPKGFSGGRGLSIAAQRFGNSFGPSFANSRLQGYDPYGLDEYDEDDLDFIDDGPVDEEQSTSWKMALRDITKYDPRMYLGQDEGEACETSWTQQEEEEIRSARIAAVEDAIELKKIQEEEARERQQPKGLAK